MLSVYLRMCYCREQELVAGLVLRRARIMFDFFPRCLRTKNELVLFDASRIISRIINDKLVLPASRITPA